MSISIMHRVVGVTLIALLVFGLVSMAVSWLFFRHEIDVLYEQDYGERLRSVEFEYAEVDATSAASEDALFQHYELMWRLERRYKDETTVAPFIVNGDQEVMLWPEAVPIPQDYAAAIVERVSGNSFDTFEIEHETQRLWLAVSYYPAWDWYSGFAVPNAVRYQVLRNFTFVLAGISAVVVLLVYTVLVVTFRSLLRPLSHVSTAMHRFAGGDLTLRVNARRRDEIGQIARSINEFADRLVGIVRDMQSGSALNSTIGTRVNENAEQAAHLLDGIARSTEGIAERVQVLDQYIRTSNASIERIVEEIERLHMQTDDQFAAVNQSTAAVEQMGGSLKSMAGIAATRRGASHTLITTAQSGGERVTHTNDAIRAIAQEMEEVAEFVTVIRAIAGQTDLLSMNAAIEAAHAGDAGRGFSVVADEIRKLAEETSQHSSSIERVIKTIVSRTQEASTIGQDAVRAFEEIDAGIRQVTDSFIEIAAGAEQLSAGSGEIMRAMQALREMSATARTASETARAEMGGVENAMNELTGVSGEVRAKIQSINEEVRTAGATMTDLRRLAAELRQTAISLDRGVAVFTIPEEATA